MFPYNKVIFVSVSDTCRSPWAEKLLQKENIRGLQSESRGTVVLFSEPINQKAVAIAKTRQIDLEEHCSVPLQNNDFGEDILVLAMTERLKKDIYDDYTEAKNVYTLKEFVGEEGDVLEPIGGELTEYGEHFELIERLVRKLAEKIKEEKEKKK